MDSDVTRVRRAYEALGAGDLAGFLAVLDPQVEWHEMTGLPYGGVYRGPDAVAAAVLAPIGRDVEALRVTPREFLKAGNRVVVLGDYTGQGRETGTRFVAPFAHVWTLRDRFAARFEQYTDTAEWRRALGEPGPPGRPSIRPPTPTSWFQP